MAAGVNGLGVGVSVGTGVAVAVGRGVDAATGVLGGVGAGVAAEQPAASIAKSNKAARQYERLIDFLPKGLVFRKQRVVAQASQQKILPGLYHNPQVLERRCVPLRRQGRSIILTSCYYPVWRNTLAAADARKCNRRRHDAGRSDRRRRPGNGDSAGGCCLRAAATAAA